MSATEKQKWCHDDDFDSDSNISTRLQKVEDDDKAAGFLQLPSLDRFNSSFSQKRLNPEKERHAELFRKDLISAMKLADSEMLQPEEYFHILDPWKLEWERGVQVPINPGAILPNIIRVVPANENLYAPSSFKLPKKYLHACQGEAFKPAVHELHEVQKLTELVCRYDLDDLDISWLLNFNQLRDEMGDDPIMELDMERVIEELETRCHAKLQQAQKTVEGLGIEYDENVVCDVCRSPEGEDSNEMVFCDSCDICVHQACYGIQMIPEGNWLCRACALGIKPQCVLCPNPGGAMKSTKNGSDWAHISCALWIPEVHIGCPEKMEPINNINQIPASRWALVCTICRERQGACIQCSIKSCKTSFHVTCAFQNNLEMHQTYDEKIEDVQMKAFCPKHSGQKNDDSITEDGTMVASPKPQTKLELTEEEKTELRSHRLKKLEEEFYNYVTPKEVAEALEMDEEMVDFVYNYWVIKRKSQCNHPLLMPKLEEGDILLKQREDGLVARLKMFIHLRQELERVRNLCYMVNKREKLSRQMYRMKEDIFCLLAKTVSDDGCQDDLSVLNSYRMTNTIYDHPEGILRAARLLEQNEQAADAQDTQATSDKDGELSKHVSDKLFHDSSIAESQVPSILPVGKQVFDLREEFSDLEKTCIKSEPDVAKELSLDQEPNVVTDYKAILKFEDDDENSGYDAFSKIGANSDGVKELNFTQESSDGFLREASFYSAKILSNSLPKETLDDSETENMESSLNLLNDFQNNCLGQKDKIYDEPVNNNHGGDNRTDHLPELDLSSTIGVNDVVEKTCENMAVTINGLSQGFERIQSYDDTLKEAPLQLNDSILLVDMPCKSPSYQADLSEREESHENCIETDQLEKNKIPFPVLEKPEAVRLKRRQGAVSARRSRRCNRSDKTPDLLLEKKDSSGIPCPESLACGQPVADNEQNLLQSSPEFTQNVQKEEVSKWSYAECISNSGRSPGLNSATKEAEQNGWSSIKHKLSSYSQNGLEILKRFSPEQLIVSKEIKQRVERCLLNLPCLKSFNGICKHLQQKLNACNLQYAVQTIGSSKTMDKADSSVLLRISTPALKRKMSADDWYETDVFSKTKLRRRSSLRTRDSGKRKHVSDERNIWTGGGSKQQRTSKNQTVLKLFKYDYDASDSSEAVNGDFVSSELSSSECSRSSIGNSYSSEQDLEADVGGSSNSNKQMWFSKFKS